MRRVLIVASRWPWPVSSGHQRMLDQMARMAASAGYETHMLSLSRSGGDPPPSLLASAARLPLPGMGEAFINLLTLAPGMGTMQECLFRSRVARRMLADAVTRIRPDVVVYDMLRGGQYGLDPGTLPAGCRRVAYLDDLLSVRYRMLLKSGSAGNVLGYFGQSVPSPLRRAAGCLSRLALMAEIPLADRRERQFAEAFDATLLVSRDEADRLRASCPGRAIGNFPPAVQRHPARWDAAADPRFVFIGPGDYAPNAAAVWLIGEAAGELRRRGRPLRIVWAGRQGGVEPPNGVTPLGFVDDLGTILSGGAILLAPMGPGTGMVTKVAEAMAHGVPVVASPDALRGLGACPDGDIAVIARSGPAGLADAMLSVAENGEVARQVAARGHLHVDRLFSWTVLQDAFAAVLRGPGNQP